MKKCMLGACAAILACCGLVQASPFDPSVVSADAEWLIHVDADAARQSQVVQKVYDKWQSHETVRKNLDRFRDETGIDISKNLHAATFYGDTFGKPNGIMVAKTDADRQKIVAELQKKPDFKTFKHGDYTIYTWTPKHDQQDNGQHIMALSFIQSGLVMARLPERLNKALDVLAGDADSLPKDSALAADVDPGTYFVLRGTGLDKADLPEQLPILRHTQYGSLMSGEKDGVAFSRGKLITDSNEIAQEVQKTLEGFRALGELRFGEGQEEPKVLKALKISVDGKTVSTDWRVPTGDAIQAIDKIRERVASRQQTNQQEKTLQR